MLDCDGAGGSGWRGAGCWAPAGAWAVLAGAWAGGREVGRQPGAARRAAAAGPAWCRRPRARSQRSWRRGWCGWWCHGRGCRRPRCPARPGSPGSSPCPRACWPAPRGRGRRAGRRRWTDPGRSWMRFLVISSGSGGTSPMIPDAGAGNDPAPPTSPQMRPGPPQFVVGPALTCGERGAQTPRNRLIASRCWDRSSSSRTPRPSSGARQSTPTLPWWAFLCTSRAAWPTSPRP